MYYLRSRYYISGFGKFLNADILITDNQHWLFGSQYSYCSNSPILYHDPHGCDAASAAAAWGSTMWWLTAADLALPIGDIIYWGGLAILSGFTAYGAVELADQIIMSYPTDVLSEELSETTHYYSEHTKGARPSTKNKHQRGQTRKKRDKKGGEKGDPRRPINRSNKSRAIVPITYGEDVYVVDTIEYSDESNTAPSGTGSGGRKSWCVTCYMY